MADNERFLLDQIDGCLWIALKLRRQGKPFQAQTFDRARERHEERLIALRGRPSEPAPGGGRK